MNGYVWLAAAIVSEVTGGLALKASDGMTRLAPAAVVVLGYGASFFCLAQVVKVIPLGVSYAIWSGVGLILMLGLAMALFGQRPDLPALAGMALIIAGVVVIRLYSKMSVE